MSFLAEGFIKGFVPEIPPPEPSPETGTIDPGSLIPYLAERCDRGKLAVLVGAGASASAGLPLWFEIGDFIKQTLHKVNPKLDDVAGLASLYVERVNMKVNNPRAAKKRLIDVIQNLLYSSLARNRPGYFGEIYPRLQKLPVSNFYTTNWDQLLFHCLSGAGPVESFDNDTISFSPAPATGGTRHLVYLHGTVPGLIDQIIVTLDDYREFEKLAQNVFERLLLQFKSDTTLLCLGYSFGDLNVVSYLQKAKVHGDPGSRIYAILPRPTLDNAYTLWKKHGIYPVALDAKGPALEKWICAFLDALLGSLNGRQQAFVPPPVAEVSDVADQEEVEEILRRAETRVHRQGLDSPAEWFIEWRGARNLKPEPPPTHYLLDTVFVERGIKAEVMEAIKAGRKAGISGLVGIGGVGKSFLAMKISQELATGEDWDIAWIGLLNQGTLEALDLLAGSYGLRFLEGLRVEERILALRYLFSEVARGPRRTLVVLDNAERFPDLPLLLEALSNVPVLITSRTEECRDVIRYHRIDSMSGDEATELCKLYLNTYDSDRFDRLGPEDREDLRSLCHYLGGHPLGIRLVLSGFVRRRAMDRLGRRPFSRIHEEIAERGLSAIPDGREPNSGRAGETLHRTVYSTFEWLFRDLPEIYPEAGDKAKLLLPILSALGADQVSLVTISSALKNLSIAQRMAAFVAVPSADEVAARASEADATKPSPTGPLAGVLDPSPPADLIPQPLIVPPAVPSQNSAPPDWLSRIEELERDKELLDKALDALVAVSLVELDEGSQAFRIHPLIREFSFEERARCERRNEQDTAVFLEGGPPLESIFQCALAVLSPSPEYADSLLDLLPRLRGKRKLAEQACSKILAGHYYLQSKLGEWELSRLLLESSLSLAQDEQLTTLEGKVLCCLGELLDRMERPDGITMMRRGVEILAEQPFPWKDESYVWAVAYLNPDSYEADREELVRTTLHLMREILACEETLRNLTSVEKVTGDLRKLSGEGPGGWQLGLSSSGNFLSNSMIDLRNWLILEVLHRPKERAVEQAEELYTFACQRIASETSGLVCMTPERRADFQLHLVTLRDLLRPEPGDQLKANLEDILAFARKAGIGGTWIRLDFGEHLWRQAILARDWSNALRLAQENLAHAAEYLYYDSNYGRLPWEVRLLLSQAAVYSEDSSAITEMERRLGEAEMKARGWGRNDLLGWLLLAHALLDSSPLRPNPHSATRALVQCRKAFQRVSGCVPPEAAVLASHASQALDRTKPVFEDLRDALHSQDRIPPDYRSWLPSRRGDLPERAACKKDGKPMRLVREGLQSGPHGREVWLYPFYIDESPVSMAEYSAFLADRGDTPEVLGEGELAGGMTFESAESYADWSGKRLPNSFEWYAAKWQLAAGHSPETWSDWSTARRRMFERIEQSFRGKIWDAQPLLPGQRRQEAEGVSTKPSASEIEYLRSGEWLRKDPDIEAAFLRRISEFGVDTSEFSAAFLRLASAEAFSIRPMEERILSLRQAATLSTEELTAACGKLESEQNQHDDVLPFWGQAEFLDWLFHGPQLSNLENVQRLMAGGWLQDKGRLGEIFVERMVAPLASNQVGFPGILAQELARCLAGSISLTVDEKKRILAASPGLSLLQLQQLLEILREEQQKFFQLDPKHLPQLEALCLRHNSQIVDWLLDEMPGFGSSQVDLAAVWSSAHSRAVSGRHVLLENPFKDRAWTQYVLKPADSFERWRIGIRCVLPIATCADLDAVEAL